MAFDITKPVTTDAYASVLSEIVGNVTGLAQGLDPATVTLTSVPTASIRWTSAGNKWQIYSGSVWGDLSNLYAINISGNAATATTAAAVPWSGITSKPTTLSTFGITDAAPIASPAFTGSIPTTNGVTMGYLGAPQNVQTTGYTLVVTDKSKSITITTGGVTVPNSIFSGGDIVTVYNNSGSAQTITQGTGVTLRLVGTATTGNRTLAQHGICTIYFNSASEAVATGVT